MNLQDWDVIVAAYEDVPGAEGGGAGAHPLWDHMLYGQAVWRRAFFDEPQDIVGTPVVGQCRLILSNPI